MYLTFLKVREGYRIVGMALAIADKVREMREREILGLGMKVSEDSAWWDRCRSWSI
jgi:transposase-like protein